jgi:hypothetical protein
MSQYPVLGRLAENQVRVGRRSFRSEAQLDVSERPFSSVGINLSGIRKHIQFGMVRRQSGVDQVSSILELAQVDRQDSPSEDSGPRLAVGEDGFQPILVGQSSPEPGPHGRVHPVGGVTAEQSEQGPGVRGCERSTRVRSPKVGCIGVEHPPFSNPARRDAARPGHRAYALLAEAEFLSHLSY